MAVRNWSYGAASVAAWVYWQCRIVRKHLPLGSAVLYPAPPGPPAQARSPTTAQLRPSVLQKGGKGQERETEWARDLQQRGNSGTGLRTERKTGGVPPEARRLLRMPPLTVWVLLSCQGVGGHQISCSTSALNYLMSKNFFFFLTYISPQVCVTLPSPHFNYTLMPQKHTHMSSPFSFRQKKTSATGREGFFFLSFQFEAKVEGENEVYTVLTWSR